jgi:O-6-methylguanine DNA methyltransferase
VNDHLEADLAALAQPAPDRFDHRVLHTVGLADAFTRRDFRGGELLVAFNGLGVSAIGIIDDAHTEDWFVETFSQRFGRPFEPDDPPARLADSLDEALETGWVGRLPLDLRGMGEFHRLALEQAARIPPGEVRSYGWIARETGRPRAARAVGTAMATNPIPVVLPCHRVVRNDGSLGNYGYGLPMKRHLLSVEGLDVAAIESLAARGVRFVGSATTGVYCVPSCRNARRITDRHRLELRSPEHAHAEGFRPCRVCRPDA